MIAPDSKSYPIMGAALAAGVAPAIAYRMIEAVKVRQEGGWLGPSAAEPSRIYAEGVAAHGEDAMIALQQRLMQALDDGHIYAPWWPRSSA